MPFNCSNLLSSHQPLPPQLLQYSLFVQGLIKKKLLDWYRDLCNIRCVAYYPIVIIKKGIMANSSILKVCKLDVYIYIYIYIYICAACMSGYFNLALFIVVKKGELLLPKDLCLHRLPNSWLQLVSSHA